jgi:hypothetical protein
LQSFSWAQRVRAKRRPADDTGNDFETRHGAGFGKRDPQSQRQAGRAMAAAGAVTQQQEPKPGPTRQLAVVAKAFSPFEAGWISGSEEQEKNKQYHARHA